MAYISSLTYILTGMLTTLPYYSSNPILQKTSYNELIFIDTLFALNNF